MLTPCISKNKATVGVSACRLSSVAEGAGSKNRRHANAIRPETRPTTSVRKIGAAIEITGEIIGEIIGFNTATISARLSFKSDLIRYTNLI